LERQWLGFLSIFPHSQDENLCSNVEGATSGLALASRPTEDLDAAVSVDDLGGGSLGLVGDFNLGKTNLDMVGVSRWVGQ
jgi:hypothetical protein